MNRISQRVVPRGLPQSRPHARTQMCGTREPPVPCKEGRANELMKASLQVTVSHSLRPKDPCPSLAICHVEHFPILSSGSIHLRQWQRLLRRPRPTPTTVLSVLCILGRFHAAAISWGCAIIPHFSEEDTEAQRGVVTGPSSDRQPLNGKANIRLRSRGSRLL